MPDLWLFSHFLLKLQKRFSVFFLKADGVLLSFIFFHLCEKHPVVYFFLDAMRPSGVRQTCPVSWLCLFYVLLSGYMCFYMHIQFACCMCNTCVAYMCSLHVSFTCVVCMCSLHVYYFMCVVYMCSLYAWYTYAIYILFKQLTCDDNEVSDGYQTCGVMTIRIKMIKELC